VPPGITVRKLDDLKFCLSLSQAFSHEPQFPTFVLHGQIRNNIVMQRGCNSSANVVSNSDRFHLEKLFSDGVRLYNSRNPKPQSYVVTDFSVVNSHDQAFELVEKYSDYQVDRTVIENYSGFLKPKVGYFRSVKLTRPSPNEVSIVASGPGFLILTDSFYPGWKCTVNGKESTIFRANGYFRAVEIGNGQNNVVFRFQPTSFILGFWICAITLFALSFWLLLHLALKVKRT
jgi:Bacterial membrane protein YfhO